MYYLEITYLERLASYLRNFKKISDRKFNFSCPFCGDSEKDKKKARGYVFDGEDKLRFYCHNCHKSTNIQGLLKHIDHSLFLEYKKEKYSGSAGPAPISKEILQKKKEGSGKLRTSLPLCVTVHESGQGSLASKFCRKRKIPESFWGELYYTEVFGRMIDRIIPDKYKLVEVEDRLVIPFRSKSGNIFGLQGRALWHKSPVRYITCMFDDDVEKVYGLDRVDMNRKFYVTEGPIDSMFLENAIAACGSDICSQVTKLGSPKNAVLVFDNEPRNKDIVKQYKKALESGFKVCVWPDFITCKDVNDMVLDGYPGWQVQELIDRYTFEGTVGLLQLSKWSKV